MLYVGLVTTILGLALAALAEGAVQAVFLSFSPVDVYEDILMHGGMQCMGFTDTYATPFV